MPTELPSRGLDGLEPNSSGPLSLNERNILDCVRRQRSVPRRDIAGLVGLTEATVSRLTRNLEERGLIREIEAQRPLGQRGHPIRPLSLNSNGAYAVGIDFYPNYLDVGVLNLNGELVWKDRTSIANPKVSKISALTRRSIEKCTKHLGISLSSLCGVGVAVPGYRAKRPGSFAVHPDFDALLAVDLQASLSTEFGLPVFIERDAVAAAIGDTLLGSSRDAGSICFIYIAQGIGGALLNNGKVIHGAHGNAGGIGALFPDDRIRPSGDDLFKYLTLAGVPIKTFTDLEQLDPNQSPLREWIVDAGRELRAGAAVISRLFDPNLIVVGGHLPTTIAQALVSEIGVLDRPPHYTDDIPYPDIQCSAFGTICSLVGAASLPLLNTFFL